MRVTRIRHLLSREWQHFRNDERLLVEGSLSAQELTNSLTIASLPSLSYYSLLTLATVIATWGLLANNAVTIIGAMIVAPLMNPIVALSYAAIAAETRLLGRAIITLVTGVILVLALSCFATHLMGSRAVGFQILARVEPNLLDLGIAVASGAAVGLAYARRSISNTLPGVAIAVALVPPLCVTGIGIALGNEAFPELGLNFGRLYQELNLAGGSFLLFLTNLAGIIFCAGLVFLLQGYGTLRRAIAGLSFTLVVVVILALPLSAQFDDLLLRNQVLQSLDRWSRLNLADKQWLEQADSTDIYVEQRDQKIFVRLNVLAPINNHSEDGANSLQNYQHETGLIETFLSEELEKPVELEINLFTFHILKNAPVPEGKSN